jgi:hypothetical protein
VRVLSRLFRRRFLEALAKAHAAGQLQFFGEYAALVDKEAFADWLKPLRLIEWVVYAKRPFAGPTAVLAYLARYTHRIAIANSRLISLDEHGVTFKLAQQGCHRLSQRWLYLDDRPCRRLMPPSDDSNPHRHVVYLDSRAASRGFLPRGLSDTCPLNPDEYS